MKTIGVDLDGFITKVGFYNPSVKLPWWLFYVLVPIIVFLRPDKQVIREMRSLKDQGCKFIVVTARPNQLFRFTEQLLKFHGVPFDQLFCVGFGKGTKERKLKVINDNKVDIYVDKDVSVVKYMQQHSVRAATSLSLV